MNPAWSNSGGAENRSPRNDTRDHSSGSPISPVFAQHDGISREQHHRDHDQLFLPSNSTTRTRSQQKQSSVSPVLLSRNPTKYRMPGPPNALTTGVVSELEGHPSSSMDIRSQPPVPPKVADADSGPLYPGSSMPYIAQRPSRPTAGSSQMSKSFKRKPVASSSYQPPEPSPGGSQQSEKVMLAASDSVSASMLSQLVDSAEMLADAPGSASSTTLGSQTNHHENQSPAGTPPPYARQQPFVNQSRSISATLPRERSFLLRREDTNHSSMLGDPDCPPLIKAVKEGREDVVADLLDQGVNIDDQDPRTGRTAIMEAARLSRREPLRMLVRAGSRLHLKDRDGCTALHLSAAKGDALNCNILLDAGSQLESFDEHGRLPLQLAAEAGHFDALVTLLEHTPTRSINDPSLVRAWYYSIKLGDLNSAQEFLSRGVVPKKIKEAWKPVAYAAKSGNPQMLDFVLAKGCNLKATSPENWNTLHFASQNGRHAMVQRLLDMKIPAKARTKKWEETPLHLAVAAGQLKTAQVLIGHKDAGVTLRDADDQEPLHLAVRRGDYELVTALMEEGAKGKNHTRYGWFPIHIATAYGHALLVAELITRGISIEEGLEWPGIKKATKKTSEAARKGYWAEIRWPHPGARALHLAIEFGHDVIAKMLIAAGARIDEPDNQRWYPIHYAAFHCRPSMVELLLQKGASAHVTTIDGNTPMQLGFREHGLNATNEERARVGELLQAGMTSQKKSAIKSLTQFRLGAPKSRTARDRNHAWHLAVMAEALHQPRQTEEGEAETLSLADSVASSRLALTESNYSLYEVEMEGSPVERRERQQSFGEDRKSSMW